MSALRYHFTMFGKPDPPERDTVESGIYHPFPDTQRIFECDPGAVLLIYCTGAYAQYAQTSPGLGLVFAIDERTVRFHFVPFDKSIDLDELRSGFHEDDRRRLNALHIELHHFREISARSFRRVVADRRLMWPGQ